MLKFSSNSLNSFIQNSSRNVFYSQRMNKQFKTLNFLFSTTQKMDKFNHLNFLSQCKKINQRKYSGLIHQNNFRFSTSGGSGGSGNNTMIFIIGGVIIGGIALYSLQSDKKHKDQQERNQSSSQKMTLSEEKIKQIQRKSIQLYDKKLSDLIQSFTEQMPPTLKYSNQKDPDQLQQLIEYTIGPDINLYEVPSILMSDKQKLSKLHQIKKIEQIQKLGVQFNPFPLTKIRVNSALTLSLQAQRCLQNIYIKIKDVADEIEQTGKYTPPKIFFRFFGYIMFDIRQKPLSLLNYRDTEYISLFDLFFDYYSPIPIKRHQFNQYLVGFNESDERMYGQVHINHRKITEKFITRNDKVVVMKDNVAELENKYVQIWNDFYSKYMRIWKLDKPGRISTTHL